MRDKHIHFSLALFIAITCLVGVSIFVDSDLFISIAKVITLPLLVFTFANATMSIINKVVNKYLVRIHSIKEQHTAEKWHLECKRWRATIVQKIKDIKGKDDEDKKWINETLTDVQNLQSKLKSLEFEFVTLNDLIEKIKSWVVIDVLYIFFLNLLIIGIFLSPILAPFFDFITLPTFTFVAFLLLIAEILLSDKISEILSTYLYKKEKTKSQITKDETPNE